MVYQTFSLWVEEFLGEKFSTGKKSSHFKRKILTANFSVQNKNCHTKTKFSRRKKNSQSELKKKCVCVGGWSCLVVILLKCTAISKQSTSKFLKVKHMLYAVKSNVIFRWSFFVTVAVTLIHLKDHNDV